jgi:hypothetical protein
MTFDPERLLARLKAAHVDRPLSPYQHVFDIDVDTLRRDIGGDDVAEPIKRRVSKPTLASIKRPAAKAGVEVAAYEFRSDGTIVAIVGTPGKTKPDSGNEWDGVLQ